jgi:phosphoglycerate dehydrogenase-like enzyme
VFDDEPNVPQELLELENVVLTPHIASATEETYRAMGDNVVANLLSWFSGGRRNSDWRWVDGPTPGILSAGSTLAGRIPLESGKCRPLS